MQSPHQLIIMTLSILLLTLSVNAQESKNKKESTSKSTATEAKETKTQGNATYLSKNQDFDLNTTKIDSKVDENEKAKKPDENEKAKEPKVSTSAMNTTNKKITTEETGTRLNETIDQIDDKKLAGDESVTEEPPKEEKPQTETEKLREQKRLEVKYGASSPEAVKAQP